MSGERLMSWLQRHIGKSGQPSVNNEIASHTTEHQQALARGERALRENERLAAEIAALEVVVAAKHRRPHGT